jgi:hypothetical protein
MRAKTLILAGVVAMVCVVALGWSVAQRRAATPAALEPADPVGGASPPVTRVPRPAAAAPAAAPVDAPGAPVTASKASEGDLMAAMRADLVTNPARALQLARDGERRYGDTRYAAERGRVAIESLVRLNQIAEARDAAEPFIRKYRGTDHARYVENLTGVHPRPSGPTSRRPDQPGGSSP